MFYAQLNDVNICVSVSKLNKEVESNNMIMIDTYNESLLGKKYNNGIWEDVETETLIEELTDTEIIQAQILLNQQDIMIAQYAQEVRDHAQDEVLAAILLAQQTV